ncbi:guanine nucleotide-binding protein subunit gamma 1-like [Canna indica]|uniref:Guanine nucleotide-binding protein subunit gamma 1-like n=1 Tax=Canna indica TaxID=4628 RepID=A0AAQ3KZI6_9LILI|nr:guanine nucleotide-binding protein subunit gamma 1-like [Canna indica]
MQSNRVDAATEIDYKAPDTSDTRGRHRISAELKRLEQEARFLEEELEELEKTEKVSTALQELLLQVENRRDPLLPETTGPANPSWDCWFEGPQNMQGCRCWIL